MKNTVEIYINQIGYLPAQNKYAYISGCNGGESFSVIAEDGSTVYEGKLSDGIEDRVAGEKICTADFTSVSNNGIYTVKIDDFSSYKFEIGNKIYEPLYFSTLNYFYLSRCGEVIDGVKHGNNSTWSRPACHTSDAVIYGTNVVKSVTGGWHDAGDYGRYVVAGAKTVMDLLLAYEQSKDSYNGFDILDEVKFELKWMLDMQRKDGAVFHKISCYHFCAFINPQDEKDQIVIAPVSTTATADFAGCAAYASKFYKNSDPEFSKQLLNAAVLAQDYLSSHEDEIYKNPAEITTGGYGDWNTADERFFALCSLYAATKDEKYLSEAKQIRETAKSIPETDDEPWKRHWMQAFSWGSVAAYGSEILLKMKNVSDKAFLDDIKNEILERADEIAAAVEASSFGISLGRVFWGSNGHVCDEGHMLLLAYYLTNDKKYKDYAYKQLDYVLGCNPMNICYVTGHGTECTKHPHHRPSGAMGQVMPGMLAGGPSEGLQDAEAKRLLPGKAPLRCYADVTGSYSTNEIAIYWNSPLVYLIASLTIKE